MPYRPKKPCRHPGCANLTDGRYCEEHISCHPELLAQPQSVDTEVNGEHQARHILENILCARFVRGTGNTFKLRWLTISNRTEVIINCFGIKATGRAFVRAVMIKKRDGLTVNLHTVTEIVPIFIWRTNRCVFLFFAV